MERKEALEILGLLGLKDQAARHDIAIAVIRKGVYLSAEERSKLGDAQKALEASLPEAAAEQPLAPATKALLAQAQSTDVNRKAALRAAVGAYFAREAAVIGLEATLRNLPEQAS